MGRSHGCDAGTIPEVERSVDSLGDGTPPVFSLPDSFLGGVGRTVRARGKTSGGYIAVWARVVGKRARLPGQ